MGFLEDLKLGKTYEKELLNHLNYDEFKMCVENKSFSSWDIEITKDNIKTYYEVKSDRKAFQSGNIAIEYICNNKPSGISTTKSDYYAYFIINSKFNTYDLYIIPIQIIHSFIQLKKYKMSINGGDNYKSKMYLFDIRIFKDFLQNTKNFSKTPLLL